MLVQNLQNGNWSVSGVIGPTQTSEKFANTWAKLTGQQYKISTLERLFVIDQVIPPQSVPGRLRVATEQN